jgi:cyanophycinase
MCTGGDQYRLVQCLFNEENGKRVESPLLAAIHKKLDSKEAVIAGTSAGMAIQTGPGMIDGGVSYEALRYGAYDKPQLDDSLLVYVPDGGFNFFPYGLLDTHFGARGRQGRLIKLLSHLNISRGFACDENTAIVIVDDQFTVLGTNGVTIIDVSRSKRDDHSISNITIQYLTNGDSYDLISNKIEFASWKTSLAGREEHIKPLEPTNDIFSSYRNQGRKYPMEFVRVSTDLYNSKVKETYGLTFETNPVYQVQLMKGGAGYQGVYQDNSYISFEGLNVAIREL